VAKQQFVVPVDSAVNGPQPPRVLEVDEENKLVDTGTGEKVPSGSYLFFLKKLRTQTKKYEKWFLSQCSDSEFLEAHNASPVVEGGQIVALEFYRHEEYDDPYEPSKEDYDRLGLDPEDLGCVEPHPEGADRGGYVPTLTNGCYYSESCCEWQS